MFGRTLEALDRKFQCHSYQKATLCWRRNIICWIENHTLIFEIFNALCTLAPLKKFVSKILDFTGISDKNQGCKSFQNFAPLNTGFAPLDFILFNIFVYHRYILFTKILLLLTLLAPLHSWIKNRQKALILVGLRTRNKSAKIWKFGTLNLHFLAPLHSKER